MFYRATNHIARGSAQDQQQSNQNDDRKNKPKDAVESIEPDDEPHKKRKLHKFRMCGQPRIRAHLLWQDINKIQNDGAKRFINA